MSFFKNEIGKHKRLFYIKLGIIITLICISLLSLFLLIPPETRKSYLEANINWFLIDLLAFFILILTSLLIILTVNEYKEYCKRKTIVAERFTYLSFEDIFENENRVNILNQILRNPGIHHNELLRNCDLQKGQLQWHLGVLLKYNIIKKEKYGQYTIYFPITTSYDAIEYLENLIAKSKTTSEILKIIKENPGINSSEISRILSLSRNTIKYHIDKLSKEKLIILTRRGRKIELYPILQ